MELEPGSLAVVGAAIVVVLALGGVSMLRAYVGGAGIVALTIDPVPLPDSSARQTLTPKAIAAFEQGLEQFAQRRYRFASERFVAALAEAADWAQAYHNLGLCLANVGEDGPAARALAKAGELYLEGDDLQGSALARRHLSALGDRKQNRKGAKLRSS